MRVIVSSGTSVSEREYRLRKAVCAPRLSPPSPCEVKKASMASGKWASHRRPSTRNSLYVPHPGERR